MVSYGRGKSPEVRIQDQVLTAKEEFKYLGYIESKKIRAMVHIKDRKNKMKGALSFFLGITEALYGLPIQKKRTMAKACIETVGLYGTEVMPTEDSCSGIKEEMEITQRKFARTLLKVSQNIAKEIVTMELKLNSVKTLMDFRLLIFRERLRREKSTFNTKILNLNKTRNLD